MDKLPGYLWRDIYTCDDPTCKPYLLISSWSHGSSDTLDALGTTVREREILEAIEGNKKSLSVQRLVSMSNNTFSYVRNEIICQTLLLWAAYCGHMSALQFLKNWKMTLKKSDCKRAMVLASEQGHTGVLQFLISLVNDNNFGVPRDNWEIIRISAKCKREMAREAAQHAHVDILACIRNWGIPFHKLDEKSLPNIAGSPKLNNVLSDAIFNGQIVILQYLKEWAQSDHVDIMEIVRRDRAWAYAIHLDNLDVLCLLKDWGMNMTDLRYNGNEFMLEAARIGHLEVWKYFKEWRDWKDKPDRVTVEDIKGPSHFYVRRYTILQIVADYGHVHLLQLFKEWRDPDGERITLRDIQSEKNKILFKAASGGHIEVCQFLKDWRDKGRQDKLTNADCTECLQHARNAAQRQKAVETLSQVFDKL